MGGMDLRLRNAKQVMDLYQYVYEKKYNTDKRRIVYLDPKH